MMSEKIAHIPSSSHMVKSMTTHVNGISTEYAALKKENDKIVDYDEVVD